MIHVVNEKEGAEAPSLLIFIGVETLFERVERHASYALDLLRL